MDEKRIERKRLIWEFFTENNVAPIIEEYEGNAKSVFERLEENFKQIIEKFGFKVNKKDNLFEWNIESQKICVFLRFLTKEKTALTLCIDNWEGKLTASLLYGYGSSKIINNNDSILTIENNPPYMNDDWNDIESDYLWRKVLVNDKFLCKKIDSNPYADNFEKEVISACEGILRTLAKALKDTE